MLKINNHEVSEYFKDKDIAKNFKYIRTALYQAQCKLNFMKDCGETWLHFCEALYLFATINSSVNSESLDSSKIQYEINELLDAKMNSTHSKFDFYLENEIDWFGWATANSSRLNSALNQLFSSYRNTSQIPDLYDCEQYTYTALVFALRCFEKYEDNLPYSIALMEDLFTFCLENSPAKPMVKELQKRLREEMDNDRYQEQKEEF